MDIGPNLGAINRAGLIAADFLVVPLAPDLFSLQALRNLGPSVQKWRVDWKSRFSQNPELSLTLPPGDMKPIGYIVMQHVVRLDRPVQAYGRWMNRIPGEYAQAFLENSAPPGEEHQIAQLKNFRSLIPMAQEARKPIFHLKPADGALGHIYPLLMPLARISEQWHMSCYVASGCLTKVRSERTQKAYRAHRKPRVPARSLDGAISRYFPCSSRR
jgi:hypothetical protein